MPNLWWFLKTSYGYIAPKGIKGHIRFLERLPTVYKKFREQYK